MPDRPCLLIDTCVLINLLASSEISGILRVAAQQAYICTIVKNESLYLKTDDPEEGLAPVNLKPLIDEGLLAVCDFENEAEEQLFVNYASILDDGEAMSLALAQARNWHLATDERKARRVFLEATGGDEELLTNTSVVIKAWADSQRIDTERLKRVLMAIETRARYRPPKWDEHHEWWLSASA
jgi:predicted nucleic acid-binding protein